MKRMIIKIEALSPFHLGGGKSDVLVDAEVVHDEFGLPYFPAKRLKGLLYESALELAEISNEKLLTVDEINKLFGHKDGVSNVVIDNLHLIDYEKLRDGWQYLSATYPGYFTPKGVLETYTELRYSTKIDESGLADDGSLRNIRLVDKGTIFSGNIEVSGNIARNMDILKLACDNLRFVGAKRNRGCGNVKVTLVEEGKK